MFFLKHWAFVHLSSPAMKQSCTSSIPPYRRLTFGGPTRGDRHLRRIIIASGRSPHLTWKSIHFLIRCCCSMSMLHIVGFCWYTGEWQDVFCFSDVFFQEKCHLCRRNLWVRSPCLQRPQVLRPSRCWACKNIWYWSFQVATETKRWNKTWKTGMRKSIEMKWLWHHLSIFPYISWSFINVLPPKQVAKKHSNLTLVVSGSPPVTSWRLCQQGPELWYCTKKYQWHTRSTGEHWWTILFFYGSLLSSNVWRLW